MLILSQSDVERLLPMDACIDVMASALVSLARGDAVLPLRTVILVPGTNDVITLSNVVRGPWQNATLGYWIDKDHLRRGLARASVEFLEERALELGLHRLEAGTMVENVASQRVLEACGYERYGLAPKLLYLNGAWRDHVLFQRLLHDRPL